MNRGIILGCLMASGLSSAAGAVETRIYWPGFSGAVSGVTRPVNTARASDRYLSLKIRLTAEPKAKDVAFNSAFHAVCQRHQSELLKAAKRLSEHADWRIKATFHWPVSASDGVSVDFNRHKFLWLSNCRPA